MPKRIPNISTVVIRDGKRKDVPAGVPFDFKQDEIDRIVAVAGTGSLRKLINEAEPSGEATDDTAPNGERQVADGATSNDTPKAETPKAKRGKAAQKSSTSQETLDAAKDAAKDEGGADEDSGTGSDGDEDEDI